MRVYEQSGVCDCRESYGLVTYIQIYLNLVRGSLVKFWPFIGTTGAYLLVWSTRDINEISWVRKCVCMSFELTGYERPVHPELNNSSFRQGHYRPLRRIVKKKNHPPEPAILLSQYFSNIRRLSPSPLILNLIIVIRRAIYKLSWTC